MAHDRYGTRGGLRGSGRSDDRSERDQDRSSGREERGFFDRAGDEIASWFGDEEAERRRRLEDDRDDGRERERGGWFGRERGSTGERGYRPMTGDYGRTDPEHRDFGERGGDVPRERYRGDREYAQSRRRHMEELDRDYDDYCRERQSRFEEDFGGWRQRRQQKRGLLGQIRQHMEVVGSDDQHVGTVDRVAGDRIILTKSDPESGGTHHSLSCADIDRVENDKVILEQPADKARERWRDDNRERALFEREDQGQAGPHMLDRSFSGTYRDN